MINWCVRSNKLFPLLCLCYKSLIFGSIRQRTCQHRLDKCLWWAVVVINDSPGFVAQRVVAQIVNIGCGVAQRGIATPADIDKGTKLGLGYPFGPLEWGDRLGAGAPAAQVQIAPRRGHAALREEPFLRRVRLRLGVGRCLLPSRH